MNHCFTKINPYSIFLSVALVILSILSSAQNPEPVFRRYTVDNGLPSSMVYHVFQDSKGYMWFATANGVSRYDGYRFENFDLQSGLVDNDVFEIYEDYKHRIWFIPMSGKLSYFENGEVVSYKYNSKIKDHLPSSRGPVKCSFYVDSLDYIHLSLKHFGRISISPEGIYRKQQDDKELNLSGEQFPDGKVLLSNPFHPGADIFSFKGLYQNFNLSLKEINKISSYTQHHLFCLPTPDSSIICSMLSNVFKIRNRKIVSVKNFNQALLWASIDNDNNLWIARHEGGVDCYSNYDVEKSPKMNLLRNVQVTSVLKDKEGAYWFSSLNDGVFYCSDINFFSYTKENGLVDNRINAVAVNNDGVYIGYEFGFVDLLKQDGVTHYSSNNEKVKNSSVRNIFIDSLNNRIFVCSIDRFYWLSNGQVRTLKSSIINSNVYPRKIIKSINGGYWLGTTRGLYKFDGENIVYDSYTRNDFKGVIFDLVEDKNGTIWFVTINGLWSYSNGDYKYFGSENSLLAIPSTSLLINPIDSCLWVGTNGSGIVIYKNGVKSQITQTDGLISNSVHQFFYSKNSIWVATRQGLSKVSLNNGKYSFWNFSNANGLPTNEVLSVCEYNNKVYVGSSKGLTVFAQNKITEDKTLPNVIITNFRVNNQQIDVSLKDIELKYDQNALSFDFVGFVFRNEGKVNYRYRMLGIDTSWVQTITPNCLYSGLSNGDYTFEVEAQSYSGIWSKTPASVSFTIQPQFWKRTWFLLTVALIFSIILFLIFKLRISAIKRRNDLLQNINLYKQQSLRQQMNPHFIFNTLNSIQLYILERDPISSHKYLTKFARLMRMTLDNSLNPTIPLRDEIEALRLYLDLEKLRLEGKFDYSIDFGIDESILSYKIPTLLIQPFVENAIWHGIMLKPDKSGWVKVTLTDSINTLSCIIEDNGIGRKQADTIRQLRNKEHKSRGSQITQQRIDLLNLMYKEKFNIRYEDLFNSSGESLGTKVFITIPKEINVQIQM